MRPHTNVVVTIEEKKNYSEGLLVIPWHFGGFTDQSARRALF